MDDAYWAEPRRAAATEFPRSSYGIRSDLTAERVDVFQEAPHAGPEEASQRVLTENPYLIQYDIPRPGHHGTWVNPSR